MRDIQKIVDKSIKQALGKKNLTKHAVWLSKNMKKRSRLGKGVVDNGANLSKFKALKTSTKKIRRRYKSELHPDTSPSKSNLTYTGQLLNSLRGKADAARTIIISVVARRRDGIDNNDLVGWLEKMGRKFFYISRQEKNELTDRVLDDIEKAIDKNQRGV